MHESIVRLDQTSLFDSRKHVEVDGSQTSADIDTLVRVVSELALLELSDQELSVVEALDGVFLVDNVVLDNLCTWCWRAKSKHTSSIFGISTRSSRSSLSSRLPLPLASSWNLVRAAFVGAKKVTRCVGSSRALRSPPPARSTISAIMLNRFSPTNMSMIEPDRRPPPPSLRPPRYFMVSEKSTSCTDRSLRVFRNCMLFSD